jgi:hypothetical protein
MNSVLGMVDAPDGLTGSSEERRLEIADPESP